MVAAPPDREVAELTDFGRAVKIEPYGRLLRGPFSEGAELPMMLAREEIKDRSDGMVLA